MTAARTTSRSDGSARSKITITTTDRPGLLVDIVRVSRIGKKADEYDKTLAVVGAPKEKESGPKKEKKVKQEVGKLDSEEAFPTLGGK